MKRRLKGHGEMTNDRNVYQCIIDFKSLRWRRAEVLIGDAPDVRDCTFLVLASVYRVFWCFGYIVFRSKLPIFDIAAGTMGGEKRYLFRYYGLEQLYEKKCLEIDVKTRTAGLPVDQQLIVASRVVELAGAVFPDLGWYRPMSTIDRFLQNVGVPQLKMLVATLP